MKMACNDHRARREAGMTTTKTPRELRLEAAKLLESIRTEEETIQECRMIAADLPPGGVVRIRVPGEPASKFSREDLLRVAAAIEAEIAETRRKVRELQDLANGKAGTETC